MFQGLLTHKIFHIFPQAVESNPPRREDKEKKLRLSRNYPIFHGIDPIHPMTEFLSESRQIDGRSVDSASKKKKWGLKAGWSESRPFCSPF